MKEYLKYLIKKRFPVYLSLAITFTALFVIFNGKSFILQNYRNFDTGEVTYYVYPSFLGIYAIPLAIVLTIIPIFEFGFKMHRISAEQAYSLPIKRQELYLSRFIIGFLEVIVPFTVAYLVSLIPLLTWATEYIDFLGMFIYLGIIIVVGLLFYSIIVFFASQANNTIDAILETKYTN